MRHRRVAILGLLAAAVLAPALLSAEEEGAIAWQTNVEEAFALAAREDKPLFVVFRCEP